MRDRGSGLGEARKAFQSIRGVVLVAVGAGPEEGDERVHGAKLQAALALKNLARGAESRAAVAQALSLSAAASKSDVAAAVDKLAS